MLGSIRVGSLRTKVAKSRKPKETDTVVRFDRANPILGNRHILYDPANSVERAKVILAYKRDLEFDIVTDGPMSKELHKLADKVLAGEHIIGMCWCSPLPCHGDHIVREVMKIVDATST